MDKTTHPYFVPDDTQGNRRDTAVLLVGTATEGDSDGPIPQREVAATQGGFRISERVYKALGWDEDDSEDSVGENDARQVPGQVVSPLDTEDTPTEDEVDGDDEEPVDEVDYDSQSVEDLKALAEAREIEVTGTGKDGNVLKADLVAALTAYDDTSA